MSRLMFANFTFDVLKFDVCFFPYPFVRMWKMRTFASELLTL